MTRVNSVFSNDSSWYSMLLALISEHLQMTSFWKNSIQLCIPSITMQLDYFLVFEKANMDNMLVLGTFFDVLSLFCPAII